MILRLTLVELRKSVDTRAARVLLALLVLISAGTAVISSQGDPTLSDFVGLAVLPLPLLLPIIAILAVTGDWTQRVAMTTFSLVPRRHYVLVARLISALVLVLVTMLVIAGVAALVFVFVHADALPRTDLADLRATLWSVCAIALAAALSGVAIGSLLLNTPAAIVVTMLLPISYDIGIGARFPEVAPWISSLAFSQWLANPQWTWFSPTDLTRGLGPALASLVLWVLLPLAAGWWRQLRREVK